jgi:hypothetical protein
MKRERLRRQVGRWLAAGVVLYAAGMPAAHPSASEFEAAGKVASFAARHWQLLLAVILLSSLGLLIDLTLAGEKPFSIQSGRDPWENLRSRKRASSLALLFFLFSANYAFLDVIWNQQTLVSPPTYRLPSEKTSSPSYVADPIAGSLIEAPGIWTTNRYFEEKTVPLWNPYEACGSPYAADGELGALSLLQLPLHLRPGIESWDLYALGRMVLAAWLAFLWLIGIGLSGAAGLFGGLAYGFGGAFVLNANLVHLNTSLWIPAILLATESLLFRRTWWRWIAFVSVYGLAINGGNPQPVVVATLIVLLRTAWACGSPREGRIGAKGLLVLGSALLAGGAVSAVSWLPLADLLRNSASRGGVWLFELPVSSLLSWGLPADPSRLTGEFPPRTWYVGVTTLSLFLVGQLVLVSEKRPSLWIWEIVTLLFIAIIYVSPVRRLFCEAIPVLNRVIWLKYVSSLCLMLIFFACIGLDRLGEYLHAGSSKGRWVLLAAGLVILSTTFLYLDAEGVSRYQWRIMTGTACGLLLLSALPGLAGPAVALAPVILLIELSAYHPNYPLRTTVAYAQRPETVELAAHELSKPEDGLPVRFLALGTMIPPLTSSYLKFEDIRSVSPMPLKTYHRWFQPFNNGLGWGGNFLMPQTVDTLLSPLIDMSGVRLVALPGSIEDMASRESTSPNVAMGKMYSLIKPNTILVKGLDASDGTSFALREEGEIRFLVDLVGTSARIGFSVTSDLPGSLVQIGVGRDVRRFSPPGDLRWDLDLASSTERRDIPFVFKTLKGGPVRFQPTCFHITSPLSKHQTDYQLIHSDPASGVHLYRNMGALPCVRLFRKVRLLTDINEFWGVYSDFVATGKGWDWKNELLVVDDEDRRFSPAVPEGKMSDDEAHEIVSFGRPTPNRMEVIVRARGPGWLHIAVSNDGNWKARLDGKPTDIHMANGPFMAIYIPSQGEHRLSFRYEPVSFMAGCWLSGVTLLFLCAGSVLRLSMRGGRWGWMATQLNSSTSQ